MPQLAISTEISVEIINGKLSRLLAIKRSDVKLAAKITIPSKLADVVPFVHHLWVSLSAKGFGELLTSGLDWRCLMK